MTDTIVLLAAGLAIGGFLRPIFRIYISAPINNWLCRRIKNDRLRAFLCTPLDAYRD
jgi:hypothetical protein